MLTASPVSAHASTTSAFELLYDRWLGLEDSFGINPEADALIADAFRRDDFTRVEEILAGYEVRQ